MKLTDRKWKSFDAFGENGLFDIHTTSSGIDKNKLVSDNNDNNTAPYVTRSGGANGVAGFVDPENYKYGFDPANVITIGLDTQTAFYQPHKFITGQNIHVITGEKLTPLVIQFLLPLFRTQMVAKFNWGGNGATLSRMKRLRLMLPIDDNGQPDYDFMSDYVDQQKKQLQSKYVIYAQKKLQMLGTPKPLKTLSELNWGYVRINDIATVKSGKDIYARERVSGDLPYVTSGTSNNGIGYFVGNDNKSKADHVISVNRNGAVGEAFYHPYTALFGNDCRTLVLNEQYEYAPFFIAAMLRKQKDAFSYSRKLGTARLKVLRIMLPVESDGKPDYDYMEQYVKNKMIQKYNHYLKYLNESVIGSNKL